MISLFQIFVNSYYLDALIGDFWEFLCSLPFHLLVSPCLKASCCLAIICTLLCTTLKVPSACLTLFESLAIICSLLCTALQVDLWPQLFASYDSENGASFKKLQKVARSINSYLHKAVACDLLNSLLCKRLGKISTSSSALPWNDFGSLISKI